MIQEEKELLLRDLCARLPYGVKLNFYAAATKENYTCTLLGIEPNDDKSIIAKVDNGAFMFPSEHIKPYLRPMSAMTEEEFDDFSDIIIPVDGGKAIVEEENSHKYVDFCNAHHFDYRGLIPMSLALEATKDMYNTKN